MPSPEIVDLIDALEMACIRWARCQSKAKKSALWDERCTAADLLDAALDQQAKDAERLREITARLVMGSYSGAWGGKGPPPPLWTVYRADVDSLNQLVRGSDAARAGAHTEQGGKT